MFKLAKTRTPKDEKYLGPVAREVLSLICAVGDADRKIVIKEFLPVLSDRQLESIKDLLTGYEDRPYHERKLLAYIIKQAFIGKASPTVLYETLILHEAFIGPILLSQLQFRIDSFERLVVGLRDHLDVPLDLTTPEKCRDAKALLKFSFEVGGFGAEIMTHEYNAARKLSYMKYENQELKNLVLRYADQSDKLIEASLSRETVDPNLLALMMDDETSSALNSGIL